MIFSAPFIHFLSAMRDGPLGHGLEAFRGGYAGQAYDAELSPAVTGHCDHHVLTYQYKNDAHVHTKTQLTYQQELRFDCLGNTPNVAFAADRILFQNGSRGFIDSSTPTALHCLPQQQTVVISGDHVLSDVKTLHGKTYHAECMKKELAQLRHDSLLTALGKTIHHAVVHDVEDTSLLVSRKPDVRERGLLLSRSLGKLLRPILKDTIEVL